MSAQKFSFDREFRPQTQSMAVFAQKAPDPSILVADHEAIVTEKVADALRRGRIEGMTLARGEETARLATALDALNTTLGMAANSIAAIEARAAEESVNVAFAFAKHLAGSLLKQFPVAPIEAAARQIFLDLRGAPHIVARVAPSMVDIVKKRLAAIALEMGLDGKLIVMGEPEILDADCRIEWADGGLVHDQAQLEQRLRTCVDHALAQADTAAKAPITPLAKPDSSISDALIWPQD